MVLVREVAATPTQAGFLRDAVTDWIRRHGLTGDVTDDVRLAVYEALANVVEHAYPDAAEGRMTLTAVMGPASLAVTVADNGRWSEDDSREFGGRGVPLIRALAPETSVTSAPTGTTVRMVWPDSR